MKHFKWLSLIVSLFLMGSFVTPVCAQEIDLTKKGSLTISFEENYPLNGSSYALWHVAKIEAPDGQYKYVNTENFDKVHFIWTDEDIDYWDKKHSASLIAFVGEYIDLHEIKPDYTGTITKDNKITFEDLELGIYYVRQTATGPGGYVMTSYLATIPNGEEDPDSEGYYNVTSNAKTDPYRPTSPDDDDDPTPTPPTNPSNPTTPGGFDLPGTNTNRPGTNQTTTNTTDITNTTNRTTTTTDTTTNPKAGFNLPNTATETSRNVLLLLAGGSILVGLWALYKSKKEAAR